MTWLVQNALFGDEFGYHSFIAAIDATGDRRIQLDYVFWEATIDLKLTGVTDPAQIIPFGTRSFICYARKNGWTVHWDNSFDYPALRLLGDDFINHDLTVGSLDTLQVPADGKIFVREAAGFNIIKGKVISAYAWPDWVNGFKSNFDGTSASQHDWHPIDGTTQFVMAPVKIITDEYRVWVIGDRVVSLSRYIHNGKIEYTNADEDYEISGYAQRIADRIPWKMSNYVLDIFRTDKGLRVGEINCLHCSGWYAIDSRKVVEAISRMLQS